MDPVLQARDGEEAEFSIKLEDDELRSRQLGAFQPILNGERYQNKPREDVTKMQAGSIYVGVRCQPPRYGLAKKGPSNEPQEDVPAALIRLDLSFQRLSDARLKRATVEIEVEDSETLSANAHQESIDETWQPEILRHAPVLYRGQITQVVGHRSREVGLVASEPSQVFGVSAKYADTKPHTKQDSLSIHGVRTGPEEVRWTLSEDKITGAGLPPEVSLGLLVKCTPGRKFAARVKVTADIRFLGVPVGKLVAGKKDDPLFFTPPTDMPQGSLGEKMDEIDRMDYEAGRQIRIIR